METLLACAASERPLVLVCEDLHWADPTSLELLEQLLPLTDRPPLLFSASSVRSGSTGPGSCGRRPRRDYGPRHTDLWLEPCRLARASGWWATCCAIEDLPEQLKDAHPEPRRGQPLLPGGDPALPDRPGGHRAGRGDGRWQATREVADIAIPDTLQGVLMARIDRLQEETKRVLQLAAVIGRLFLYRVLAAIAARGAGAWTGGC